MYCFIIIIFLQILALREQKKLIGDVKVPFKEEFPPLKQLGQSWNRNTDYRRIGVPGNSYLFDSIWTHSLFIP